MGNVVLLSLVFYLVSAIIQMFVHELGHYIFGLFTGYRFLYFQVGPLFLYKDKNFKLHLNIEKEFGGQCVMVPKTKESVSFVLYNLGGIIANIMLSAIGIFMAVCSSGYVKLFFLMLFVAGAIKILNNGIPRKRSKYPTDGYNVCLLCKYKTTREDYVNYLKLYELVFWEQEIDKKSYDRDIRSEETEEGLLYHYAIRDMLEKITET